MAFKTQQGKGSFVNGGCLIRQPIPPFDNGWFDIIGQGIADEYEFTSYNEVMTWFCDGAEFEDILVALQTEELSDTPAEDMLAMLAEGFSWEEIWLVVGLVE